MKNCISEIMKENSINRQQDLIRLYIGKYCIEASPTPTVEWKTLCDNLKDIVNRIYIISHGGIPAEYFLEGFVMRGSLEYLDDWLAQNQNWNFCESILPKEETNKGSESKGQLSPEEDAIDIKK